MRIEARAGAGERSTALRAKQRPGPREWPGIFLSGDGLVSVLSDAVLDLIGAPFDLCGLREGSRWGPAALRLAGIHDTLDSIGVANRDCGDVEARLEPDLQSPLRHFGSLSSTLKALRERVAQSLAEGDVPLVMGGEHTLSAASVAAALAHTEGDLAVLWIDAHADVNTPGTSDTGNIHGMPLAALAGLPADLQAAEPQWEGLLELLGPRRLDLNDVAWFGLRDVDPAERPRLQGLAITMHEIDRYGLERAVGRLFDWLEARGRRNLWISFDVDALDPILAPGTGTAVRGGLTYREAHLLAELLSEGLSAARQGPSGVRPIGIEVMETNPIHDTLNATAMVAVEWIASLLGKRILGDGGSPLL